MTYTETDFDRLSWHDCHIWAVELRVGDPDDGDWTSDLALDLDFIVEWICGVGGGGQFRVAPATLIFHGVTDPKIDIDWGRSGFQASMHPVSIASVERELVEDQKVYLDRPYYKLEDPPELARVERGRIRCRRLHTDSARGTGLDREAMPVTQREKPPDKPMKPTVVFAPCSLPASR